MNCFDITSFEISSLHAFESHFNCKIGYLLGELDSFEPILLAYRLRAIIYLKFWARLDNKALSNLHVEDVVFVPGKGILIGDNPEFIPSLSAFCPIMAIFEWLSLGDLKRGFVFRRFVNGILIDKPLHLRSIADQVSEHLDFLDESSSDEVPKHPDVSVSKARIDELALAVGVRSLSWKDVEASLQENRWILNTWFRMKEEPMESTTS